MTYHVKLTEHFLDRAWERLRDEDVSRLWRVINDGRLSQLARRLSPGEKGAVGVGFGYVVFCVDEVDPGVLAILTLLGPGSSEVIRRRRDTRLMRLPSSSERITGPETSEIEELEVYEWASSVVIEDKASSWRLGLSRAEARELGEDLLALTEDMKEEARKRRFLRKRRRSG